MGLLSDKNYEFKLITPLIMAGAEKKIELRTQSIVGILRWWFRFYKACEVKDLEELKKIEEKTWGSQERAKKFWMRIEKYPWEGRGYWAYLRMNDKNAILIKNNKRVVPKREGFKPPNNNFTVKISYISTVNFDTILSEIEKTLPYYC